eukprot:3010548-Pyramimonas_sp.AAC.1
MLADKGFEVGSTVCMASDIEQMFEFGGANAMGAKLTANGKASHRAVGDFLRGAHPEQRTKDSLAISSQACF